MERPDPTTEPTVNSTAKYVGRGSSLAPQSRFEKIAVELEPIPPDGSEGARNSAEKLPTEFYHDAAQTIIRQNDSPDLPFRFSINPYRGCEHGCAYCYARPSHETLSWNAGIDFETRILVKQNAAELLRRDLTRRTWRAEPIMISGVTDCYQPAERSFRLTRQCLTVLAECRQPFSIVTKNALVLRDLDLLQECAQRSLVHVFLSVTTMDEQLARKLEPRTSTVRTRFQAIEQLARHKVPVGVLVAPIIPGLNDHEIPAILQASRDAGAMRAGWILLRLPLSVEPVFRQWLRDSLPNLASKVEARIRECRGGNWNDSQFGRRMRGEGNYAQQLDRLFRVFARRHRLDGPLPPLDGSQFRRPQEAIDQPRLPFGVDLT